MKKPITAVVGGLFCLIAVTSAAAEGTFRDHYTKCVEQYATADKSASVMLECTAVGGKLDSCKVKENSTPGRGFDKAAICVAAYLPVGSKVGLVQVPIRFVGA